VGKCCKQKGGRSASTAQQLADSTVQAGDAPKAQLAFDSNPKAPRHHREATHLEGCFLHHVLRVDPRKSLEKLMPTLERAITIAATAHAGQIDKAGSAYILHPLRVMLRLNTEEEQIAGVLHDVVEDTSVTLDQLKEHGFSVSVLAALEALTKRPGETRMQASARSAANPLALKVKLADNAENMDLSRIPEPTAKDTARLEEYKAVHVLLEAAASAR
jgi:GTP diphosphokinase / guanosine-3',5'-bis(diphosphate) 3'-diphosphatase